MTYQVWDYARPNPEDQEQALYLGEVDAPTKEAAEKASKEMYPDVEYLFVLEKGDI